MKLNLSVNGLTYPAYFSDDEIEHLHLPWLQYLTQQQKLLERRIIVFLAAPPGVGKSTLCGLWQWLSEQYPELSALQGLAMDGFHHYNRDLQIAGLSHKKGAPETFDLALLQRYLGQLQNPNALWPIYDRQLHEPVMDMVEVKAPIVVVEGNWLLLNEEGWRDLSRYADVSLFISASPQLLKSRLVGRKVAGGQSSENAEAFYAMTDGPNVQRVLNESLTADMRWQMATDGSYHTSIPSIV
ncbi:nucleoside/nucleotide kinase family protein [Hafnia alvei]|mgnify:CR=1 FL=1|uniref:Pantothenate kinase n=1 Tax=Hafnia alvei TaxID=569 RepID=A0A1C6Z4W9_HAFAL|nr:nucleoside/nucleotide kinase family protein [Hafnia alvei]NLS52157.1 nucleoside/nucleotide kinase family protein [Hafnia alvei]SCM54157.1 hypothetical protein BN1044_03656 [Hafnia alvei]